MLGLSGLVATATVAVSVMTSIRAVSSVRWRPLRAIALSLLISAVTRALEPASACHHIHHS